MKWFNKQDTDSSPIRGAKRVRQSPIISDDSNLSTFGILDNMSLLIQQMTHNDADELDNAEKVSVAQYTTKGQLIQLITKSTDIMRQKGENSVTLLIASEYIPYFDEIFDSKRGYGKYFEINVHDDNIPITVKHMVVVTIQSRKGGVNKGEVQKV